MFCINIKKKDKVKLNIKNQILSAAKWEVMTEKTRLGTKFYNELIFFFFN